MYEYLVEIGVPGAAGNTIYYILADSPNEALERAQQMWIAEHAWSVRPTAS